MKSVRVLIVVAIACAVSAAPSGAQEPKPSQPDSAKPLDEARRGAVERYFAQPAAPQTKTQIQTPADPKDPKWVRTIQQLVKDLTDENAKLRADNEALMRQVEAYELQMRRQRENRGTFVLPPQALQGELKNSVPPGWKPFEFNGATYYLIPLKDDGCAPAARKLLLQPAREQK